MNEKLELIAAWLCFNSMHDYCRFEGGKWFIKHGESNISVCGRGETIDEAVMDFYHNMNRKQTTY